MALPGYDVTFLITDRHLQRYRRQGLVDFVCTVGRAAALAGLLGGAAARTRVPGPGGAVDAEPFALQPAWTCRHQVGSNQPTPSCLCLCPLPPSVCGGPLFRNQRHEAGPQDPRPRSGRRLLGAAGGGAGGGRRGVSPAAERAAPTHALLLAPFLLLLLLCCFTLCLRFHYCTLCTHAPCKPQPRCLHHRPARCCPPGPTWPPAGCRSSAGQTGGS